MFRQQREFMDQLPLDHNHLRVKEYRRHNHLAKVPMLQVLLALKFWHQVILHHTVEDHRRIHRVLLDLTVSAHNHLPLKVCHHHNRNHTVQIISPQMLLHHKL
jgi:hypothetical protein